MSKIYFEKYNPIGHTLQYWKDELKESGNTELTVFEGKRETGTDYFFCSEFEEVGDKGSCGKQCSKYTPTNGKSGKCLFNKNCYEVTDKSIILKIEP